MAQLPRGIAPELLLTQVQNTMPYLFSEEGPSKVPDTFPPAETVRGWSPEKPQQDISHLEYFQLCLSAHYLTCGTPVPTDVDNQIRHRLWPRQLPLETALEMADVVLKSRHWDFTRVSTRYTCGAKGTEWEKEVLSGHLGEWFTVSAGAYCALKQYSAPEAAAKREELFAAIADEVRRHSEIFGSLWRTEDGLGCLKASASVAHNFGDLDRVMDMWELAVDDPLRLEFYKLTTNPFDSNGNLRHLGRLWVAGELYKSPVQGSSMALENHRHFALRKPRAIRRTPELLIPTGPFFDDWGRQVARLLGGAKGSVSEALGEVTEALLQGWPRLPRTVGYGRALSAILEVEPAVRPLLETGLGRSKPHWALIQTPQEKFEAAWDEEARRLLDDIPSRA